MPIYHRLALNLPLATLFTYAHAHALPCGRRVAVRFRGKLMTGIVWEADVAPDFALDKILPIEAVFDDEPPLPEAWRALLHFAARYYHYPQGAAVFAALPAGLRTAAPITLPTPEKHYTLSALGAQQAPPPAAHRNIAALWQALLSGSLNLAAARRLHAQAKRYLQQWQTAGWVTEIEQAKPDFFTPHTALNAEQQAACNAVCEQLSSFAPFLLFGITGSGKTETYFEIMAQVFAAGRQVLFLLPEINLTPQLLSRVTRRFAAVTCAVLHSRSADGARTQDYLRAMTGQVQLVIGTRLAVFTPLPNLGLVVVDEEHDGSFKQDNELRYHARDLAVWRAQQAQCPIVLGSATPSLESFQAACDGRYRLLRLTKRAHADAALPEIILDDVRRQTLDSGFGAQAIALLKQNLSAGGLSMVYLNRRGFAPALVCGDCGHGFACPHCSAKMVWHRAAKQLRCHHCDYRTAVPQQCPDCGNQDLSALGHGTQRVEDTLATLFPNARIVRIDRDSTSRKDDWTEIYRRIHAREIDILVGTQMLAKGHDFAALNLVVVLNADGSLYSADFRAPEHLFAELMQVSGRAGRAEHAGRVLVQTQLPENPVFQALKQQDYQAFAQTELANRRLFAAPPTVYAAAIRADAPLLSQAMRFLRECLDGFERPPEVHLYGPAPQLMVRLAGRERAQVFVESPSRRALHHTVTRLAASAENLAKEHRKIRYSVDIDPQEC
ncbi:MAG: primosomal protein N' [Neisseria sp.]|nr:primosomal protein N' [Neisseria sp.]